MIMGGEVIPQGVWLGSASNVGSGGNGKVYLADFLCEVWKLGAC